MIRPRALVFLAPVFMLAIAMVAASQSTPPAFDPETPLEARITETPALVLKAWADQGEPPPTPHTLTTEERQTLAAALAAMPPLHQRIVRDRLQSLSFLDGMPNTAMTTLLNSGEAVSRYHWTIRAGVLHEHVSDWLTAKERTLFEATGSSLSVSIEAGTLDAIRYVLVHEGAHIVDAELGLTPRLPEPGTASVVSPTLFTAGIWSGPLVAAPPAREPLLEQVRFRAGGKRLPMDQARLLYAALQRTPFVSVYASSNWFDDLAETVAVAHLTERLHQPFRIVLREDGREVFAYEPAKAERVRARFAQLARFYDEAR